MTIMTIYFQLKQTSLLIQKDLGTYVIISKTTSVSILLVIAIVKVISITPLCLSAGDKAYGFEGFLQSKCILA
jgi:hypothetical protein